jgi:hypothetical protein
MGLSLVSGTTRGLVEDVANRLHILTRVSIGNRNVGSEVRYVDYISSSAAQTLREKKGVRFTSHTQNGTQDSSSTTSIQRPAALLVLTILGRVYMYVCANGKEKYVTKKVYAGP